MCHYYYVEGSKVRLGSEPPLRADNGDLNPGNEIKLWAVDSLVI